jgi:hypothetical protein
VMSHEREALQSVLDDVAEDGKIIALQSLSNAQLIHDLTQMVEDELARRRTDGAPPQ